MFFIRLKHSLLAMWLRIIQFIAFLFAINYSSAAKRLAKLKVFEEKTKTTEPSGHDFLHKYAASICSSYEELIKYLTTVPRYTTIRVNQKNFNAHQVAEIVKRKLFHRYGEIPDVFVHKHLYDCVMVGPLPSLGVKVVNHPVKVIVDVHCAQAILRGADVFAPGVLGLPTGVRPGTEVSVYADLDKKCLRGQTAEYTYHKCLIACGTLKMSRSSLFSNNNTQPRGVAVKINAVISQIPHVEVEPELGILQNLPSILAAHLLEVQSGHKILDMCAAPGNKASHIAALMNDTGKLIALDKSKLRVAKLENMIKDLELTCVHPYVYDSSKINISSAENCERMDLIENSFDRILLDAPCSGFGQRPMFYSTLNNINVGKNIKSFVTLQKKLMESAIPLLKTGGILVYCTCSLSIDENEAVIATALKKHPEMETIQTMPKLGNAGYRWRDLRTEDRVLMQRFGPPLVSIPDRDGIGFFICKLRKKYHVPTTVKPFRGKKQKELAS